MALTSDQLTDMQGDLGIGADESVFTDTELNRLYTRASEDYATAVYLAWRQIWANTAKFHDYTEAQTQVKKSQVYDHVKDMLKLWKDESRVAGNQVRIVGMNRIPPRPHTRRDLKNLPLQERD
jgi:hypothetical protein